MDGDRLELAIDRLIDRINTVNSISADGLKGTAFPDEVIASMHDHLGNCKHYIYDVTFAFNASEQFVSIEHATRELEEASDDLFKLHAELKLPDLEYETLNLLFHEVAELLKKATDPEYT